MSKLNTGEIFSNNNFIFYHILKQCIFCIHVCLWNSLNILEYECHQFGESHSCVVFNLSSLLSMHNEFH